MVKCHDWSFFSYRLMFSFLFFKKWLWCVFDLEGEAVLWNKTKLESFSCWGLFRPRNWIFLFVLFACLFYELLLLWNSKMRLLIRIWQHTVAFKLLATHFRLLMFSLAVPVEDIILTKPADPCFHYYWLPPNQWSRRISFKSYTLLGIMHMLHYHLQRP